MKDIEAIAREAAEKAAYDAGKLGAKEAIRETFRLFGVDIDKQESVNELRATLVHAQKWRKIIEKVGGRFMFAAILAFVAYAFTTAIDYFKAMFIAFRA